MKFQVSMHIEAGATTDETKYLAFDERYELKGVKLINNAGISAHASNYSIFKVFASNGSSEAFEWSTQNSAEGALSAGVDVSLTDKNTGLTIYDASTVIKVTKTHAGSGEAVDAMLLFAFEPARSY